MNSIVREYLPATFFREYQGLRNQLTDLIRDEHLGRSLGGTTVTLGELCRQIGEIEHAYVESLRTFRLSFDYRHPDATVERSVAALAAWYADLDARLMDAIEGLSEEDIADRHIVRGDFDVDDFSPLPKVQLDIYREALLIFYGKASIYLRSMGIPLPPQWSAWIE